MAWRTPLAVVIFRARSEGRLNTDITPAVEKPNPSGQVGEFDGRSLQRNRLHQQYLEDQSCFGRFVFTLANSAHSRLISIGSATHGLAVEVVKLALSRDLTQLKCRSGPQSLVPRPPPRCTGRLPRYATVFIAENEDAKGVNELQGLENSGHIAGKRPLGTPFAKLVPRVTVSTKTTAAVPPCPLSPPGAPSSPPSKIRMRSPNAKRETQGIERIEVFCRIAPANMPGLLGIACAVARTARRDDRGASDP